MRWLAANRILPKSRSSPHPPDRDIARLKLSQHYRLDSTKPWLLAVGMMRPGDKLASYGLLAEALDRLPASLPWSLSVVGDGPVRAEVMARFAHFAPGRIVWHGQATTERIAALMADSALYVWPGYGEAYGLAYLEAQAAGLPVVAQRVAGVPEAVEDGITALLSPEGDAGGLAANIVRLLTDAAERAAMGAAAVAAPARPMPFAAPMGHVSANPIARARSAGTTAAAGVAAPARLRINVMSRPSARPRGAAP